MGAMLRAAVLGREKHAEAPRVGGMPLPPSAGEAPHMEGTANNKVTK